MVDRGDNVEFEFAVGGCLEDSRVDFDLFHAGAVELFESCDDSCFLSCAGGTVD